MRTYTGLVLYGATRKIVRLRKCDMTYTSKTCVVALGAISAPYIWPIYVAKDIYDWEVNYRRCEHDCEICILQKMIE